MEQALPSRRHITLCSHGGPWNTPLRPLMRVRPPRPRFARLRQFAQCPPQQYDGRAGFKMVAAAVFAAVHESGNGPSRRAGARPRR